MRIDEGLYTHLLTLSGVAALVSTRIYRIRIPQSASLPAVTFQKISDVPVQSLDGTVGVSRARFQIDSWSDTNIGQAAAISEALRSALDGYRGGMANMTIGGVALENETDMHEEDTGRWRVTADYMIWYQRQ